MSASIRVPDDIETITAINYDVNVSNFGPEGDVWFDGSSDDNKMRIRVNAYPLPERVGNVKFIGFEKERLDHTFLSRPAIANSSRRIASASRRASKRSRVIAPKQRTPKPGPGNG